jgi:hypothetical protein
LKENQNKFIGSKFDENNLAADKIANNIKLYKIKISETDSFYSSFTNSLKKLKI